MKRKEFVSKILSMLPSDNTHENFYMDMGVKLLELMMAKIFISKIKPPYDSSASDSIISLAGFKKPGKWRTSLIRTIRPLSSLYTEDLRYKDLFNSPPDMNDLASALAHNEVRICRRVIPIILKSIDSQINNLASVREIESTFFLRLTEIEKTFRLSEIEKEALVLVALYRASRNFENLVDYIPTSSRISAIRRLDGLIPFSKHHPLIFMKTLGKNGILRRLGFVDSDLDPSSEIFEFLNGLRDGPLNDRYWTTWDAGIIPLDRLLIQPTDVDSIKTILLNRSNGQGVNILIGGPPGVGKSETVRSLCRHLGLKLYEIRSQEPGSSEKDGANSDLFRLRALYGCQNIAGESNSAILIDEADSLLGTSIPSIFGILTGNSSGAGKAAVNEALDRSPCVQFFVANNLDLDPSTRRRFAYAVRFNRATTAGRRSVWQTAIERYNLSTVLNTEDISAFATKYRIDAGGIDSALRNSANLPEKGWSRERVVTHIERLLNAQNVFSGSENQSQKQNIKDVIVPPELLTIEPLEDLKTLLSILDGWKGDDTAHLNGEKRHSGLTLLFSGLPGTGKSHLAHYLAEHIGRPLHLKTASNILDKFVGGTEENIRQAFLEAEQEGAVLFFDEIDSVLQSRDRANRSWEVSQVNELLSALDTFRGLFIAATNHESILDKASLRRFHFTLNFGPLRPDAAVTFYTMLLSEFATEKFGKGEIDSLKRISGLVPSDFAGLRQRLILQPGVRIQHSHLISGVVERRDARLGKPVSRIGFRNFADSSAKV